jgi:hypothetical protein
MNSLIAKLKMLVAGRRTLVIGAVAVLAVGAAVPLLVRGLGPSNRVAKAPADAARDTASASANLMAGGLVSDVPESDVPESAAPEGAAPDGAAPDGAAPDGIAPDGIAPDGAAPDGAVPDGAAPEGDAQVAASDTTEVPGAHLAPEVPADLGPAVSEEVFKRKRYTYRSMDRDDPFKSLVVETHGGADDDAMLDPTALKLVGIMVIDRERVALIEDARGFGYVVRVGDRVHRGRIVAIGEETLTIRHDLYGVSEAMTLSLVKNKHGFRDNEGGLTR